MSKLIWNKLSELQKSGTNENGLKSSPEFGVDLFVISSSN
jgi:hypothetical protein